jgi:hypothetical protein
MKRSTKPQEPTTPLGKALKTWWEREGMNQTEFATHLDIDGVRYQHIQHVMKGAEPRWLRAAAKRLNTTADDLIAGKVPPPRDPRAAGAGSQEEPVAPLIREEATGLSREEFLRVYDTLNPTQTQLLARLMAALGWVPGVKVEVIPKWDPLSIQGKLMGGPQEAESGQADQQTNLQR